MSDAFCTRFETNVNGVAFEHTICSGTLEEHMVRLQNLTVQMLGSFSQAVQQKKGPPKPGETRKYRFLGWYYGTQQDGKTPVVYLYTKWGEYYHTPCYNEQFSSLPFQLPTTVMGMTPPKREMGLNLGIIKPCDFWGEAEYYGIPNEKGWCRRKFKSQCADPGYDSHDEESPGPNGSHVPAAPSEFERLKEKCAQQTGEQGLSALLEEVGKLFLDGKITEAQTDEFYAKYYVPKKNELSNPVQQAF